MEEGEHMEALAIFITIALLLEIGRRTARTEAARNARAESAPPAHGRRASEPQPL
jgi:hypothetical protein